MSVRWRHWVALAALSVAAACVAVFLLIETGIVQRWVRQIVVSQIEQHTGARVELGGFHLHIWQLRAELDDLTLHGLEAAGTPPLFHAAHVNVAIHILSFIGKEIAIDELLFDQPQLAVRVDKNGKSNCPRRGYREANGRGPRLFSACALATSNFATAALLSTTEALHLPWSVRTSSSSCT